MNYEKWCVLVGELLDCIELAEKLDNDVLKRALQEKLNRTHELIGDDIEIK
ncbi:hypothetical protein Arnit_0631 [Arcobacter nitrofigilis DSM 7299]|uniref:Uncharacterized protein n=1 Tax=Arcobacter nitrofigilis (strain ATCC 33309 / DSM 7299 / CCUG 15893 / LMG 7604 / NCTC 12251 / CI) TaxID=572480 RepID=D5V263_ARCNC|nr:hypothetical protein [Arcobacter nitrofigilis]ADG92296.1 hypothetical protein Arnit_0631 [Arcobacter nitrofigilis DSM 7299]